jgi:predicted acyltransferase (DUF342 family)
MIFTWAPLALSAVTGGLVSLPLVPAIREVIHRKDAAPIPVRRDDGHIGNFAASFRRYIAPLQSEFAECVAQQTIAETKLPDGSCALLVGKGGDYTFSEKRSERLVLFGKPTHLGDDLFFAQDVFAGAVLDSGTKNIFRALLSEGDIFLDENSRVLRWLHADGAVVAGRNTHLYGRCSAKKLIYLSSGCRFERVHAPAIVIGVHAHGLHEIPISKAAPAMTFKRSHGRSRIHGDLHLGAGEMFLGDIVATGSIRIERETQIVGSAKGNGDVELCEQARIDGSVISSGTLRIAANCVLKGPVLAEKEIVLGANTRIGTPDSLTTINAPVIRVAPGCVIHGTLWARHQGRVEG